MKKTMYIAVLIAILSSCAGQKNNYSVDLYHGSKVYDRKIEKVLDEKESVEILGIAGYLSKDFKRLLYDGFHETRAMKTGAVGKHYSENTEELIKLRYRFSGIITEIKGSGQKIKLEKRRKKDRSVYSEITTGQEWKPEIININSHEFIAIRFSAEFVEEHHCLPVGSLKRYYGANFMTVLIPLGTAYIDVKSDGSYSYISELGEFYVFMPENLVRKCDKRYFGSSEEMVTGKDTVVGGENQTTKTKPSAKNKPNKKSGNKYYVVVKGDSPRKIAQREYGSEKAFELLCELNPAKAKRIRAGLIYVGEKLIIR